VTGGAGFIGSHVVEAFQAAGYEPLVLDDLSSGDAGNVPAGVELVEADVVDVEAVARIVGGFGPTVVCHLAAQATVTVSLEDPARDLAVNVLGTLNVCEAAREAGAPVVYASTGGALYGDEAPLPTPETFFPEPGAPYGVSKLGGEVYVTTWARLHGLPNVALRLGNVYGPRQNPHGEAGVVAIFSGRLLAGERPTVYGEGSPTRDYVHVSDVARAFVLAAESGVPGIFNVGWGRETNVLELLGHLQRAAGTNLEPELQPLRSGELRRSALDSSRIAAELGWRPEIDVADGLAETYGWYAASRG
jgi:UDP-glucose 4-epimerase